MMEFSHGTLLGGRVRYAQPRAGFYRTGIEPVLLAAAVPAEPGDRVLEGGTGAAAGLLCLLARQPGAEGVGFERDAEMAELGRLNALANQVPLTIHTGDVAGAAAYGPFAHAFANPPWHDAAGTAPATAARAMAKHRTGSTLGDWIAALALALDSAGTLTLALPATLVDEAIRLAAGTGLARTILFPLWPRAGRPAKLALLQARRGQPSRRVAAGLVLHGEPGGYSSEAEAILREGQALTLG